MPVALCEAIRERNNASEGKETVQLHQEVAMTGLTKDPCPLGVKHCQCTSGRRLTGANRFVLKIMSPSETMLLIGF